MMTFLIVHAAATGAMLTGFHTGRRPAHPEASNTWYKFAFLKLLISAAIKEAASWQSNRQPILMIPQPETLWDFLLEVFSRTAGQRNEHQLAKTPESNAQQIERSSTPQDNKVEASSITPFGCFSLQRLVAELTRVIKESSASQLDLINIKLGCRCSSIGPAPRPYDRVALLWWHGSRRRDLVDQPIALRARETVVRSRDRSCALRSLSRDRCGTVDASVVVAQADVSTRPGSAKSRLACRKLSYSACSERNRRFACEALSISVLETPWHLTQVDLCFVFLQLLSKTSFAVPCAIVRAWRRRCARFTVLQGFLFAKIVSWENSVFSFRSQRHRSAQPLPLQWQVERRWTLKLFCSAKSLAERPA